ncbi:MAG: sirohydrochlorin cobaltochelatase [Bacteroides sp.]|nr:sirohydrochlorin cobaltochelatase [Eubacterium sp.]MCM1417846.1 sirohydrochlorin cobaltochelatase [Roseburia sp.]MCM1461285.1 sirohydrochlorin cobaltochelatase [Bacteroides sp.]
MMKMKKRGLLAAALLGAFMLSGCANTEDAPAPASTEAEKPVILTVSFGTSYNDSREKTIGAVEKALASANPDYEVRRAFTAQTVIDILKERDNIETDNVDEAFDRLVSDGVKTVVIQPTHVMNGYEYDDLITAVDGYMAKFDKVTVGAPLLTSDDDYSRVADALIADTSAYNNDETAIVFMGHGTEHSANSTYAKLQDTFTSKNASNYYVGTVEATPSLDDIVAAVKAGGYKKVVLQPLMVVAGDHANNDMAGDEEDSWKTVLTNEGFEVECVLRGLGEIEAIQAVYADHVKDAINN